MIALDFPPDGTGRRDQLSAASQFVEIFDDDVGIDDDVAIVQDQRRQFFQRICEYSSLGWPGTTVVGTNSILSIRPSSIAAMRTLRANGEAGENVSFIGRISLKGRSLFFSVMAGLDPAIHVSIAANSLSVDARD